MLLRHFEELLPLKTLRPDTHYAFAFFCLWSDGRGVGSCAFCGSKELKADDGKLLHSYEGFAHK